MLGVPRVAYSELCVLIAIGVQTAELLGAKYRLTILSYADKYKRGIGITIYPFRETITKNYSGAEPNASAAKSRTEAIPQF